MSIPPRGRTSETTYFITADCREKKRLLQSERMATLFIDTLYPYRKQSKYLLHEFVVMPHHFHLLITPTDNSLERTMQFIKGGFSFRAGKEFSMKAEIWQTSFHDRRVRDAEEYARFQDYIHNNPLKAGLVQRPEDWVYSSATGKFELDEVPQRLKPLTKAADMRA
jgi:Transposase and inactivated derivatives